MLRSALLVSSIALAKAGQEPLKAEKAASYKAGQEIPISCLNRTIETGEHVSNRSQYVHDQLPLSNR